MKTVMRLGALATLFALLLILGSPGGGIRGPDAVHAAAGNNLTVKVTDTTSTNAHSLAVDAPGACEDASLLLANGEFSTVPPTVTCNTDGTWTITVTPASGSLLTGVDGCPVGPDFGTTPPGTQESSKVSLSGNVLRVLIVDGEDMTCTFTFASAVTERTLSASAEPPVIACGGDTTITAVVRDQNGNTVNGLTFKFVTDSGTIVNEGVGVATLTLLPASADATVTVSIDGEADIAPVTVTVENQCAPLSIFGSPPYLPCGGGTVKLTAVLRDINGNVVPNAIYQWSTTSGSSLDVGAPNSPAAIDGNAVLFLPSATPSATVTVVSGGESETVEVRQVCGPIAIAVTADPNVIPCGGTANLTATARDSNGRIVDGLGFHWETDMGLLYVGPPNTAAETDPFATLTLTPGMTNAKVRAWVGGLSDYPGEITVQQFCPDVVTDGSGATGSIQLSASSMTAGCGEAIFIGARVRDAKNQVPAEGTDVRFIASAGVFQVDAGVTTTYGGSEASQALTTVSQYNAATNKNGVLNITYLAPLYGGDVAITAASGDKFTKMIIKVNCAAPPPAAVASTGGTGGASTACTPIGDGVCIRPPSTGATIRPPSTGDAGLK